MAYSIFKVIKRPISWILFLALFLRLWGVTYGFPLFLVNDERAHVYGSLKMIELKTLVPAFHEEEFKKVLYYPPFLSHFFLVVLMPVIGMHWLFSGLPSVAEYKTMLALDPSFIWIAARVVTAVVGVLDVLIIYLLALRFFRSERAGVFAALFAALSFYHIQLSHNVRHWLFASFFLTLTWFFSVLLFERGASLKTYAGLGALIGVAAGGVNTAAVIGLIPLVFSSIFRGVAVGSAGRELKKLAALVLSFAVVALFFVALYPYGFTRAEGAVDPSADVVGRFALLSQKSFSDGFDFLGQYLRALLVFEPPLFLIGLFGIGLLFWKKIWFWPGVFIVYSLSFFSVLYLFDDYTVRGIVFIIPLLAVFAGYAADVAWQKLRNLEIEKLNSRFSYFLISIFFFFILFGWQFATDLRYDWLLSQKDTRLDAVRWVNRNLPAESKIVMDSQSMRLTSTKEGIENLRALDPSALRAQDAALLSVSDEKYPQPAYTVLNLNFISKEKRVIFTPDFFEQNGFKFLIIEYPDISTVAEDTGHLVEGAVLIRRFSQWKSPHEHSFDGSGKLSRLSFRELFQMERFGFFVDVYELR